jgi:hypothetical protein
LTNTAQRTGEGRKRTVPRRWRAGPPVMVLALLAAGCGGGGPHAPVSSGAAVQSDGNPSTSQRSLVVYASCMRANGITDFPDPTADGTLNLQGLDLKDNPQWQSALQACQRDLPGGGPEGKLKSSLNIPAELTFAACMRSHGITDFPDPTANGVFDLPQGLDPNSPQLEAAQTACQTPGSPGIPMAITGSAGS